MSRMDASAPSQKSSKSKTYNGGQIFLEVLTQLGVEKIYGLPGGVILPIYDNLRHYDIKHYLVRHEQGACHMAEGYARATGKPGVVLVTSGPGATNILTGVADAYYDSVPMVVFTGNVATHMLGNDSFQEADICSMTRACTKHNLQVRRTEDLAEAIAEAFFVATTGRPGPVVVDLPKDVVYGQIEWDGQMPRIDLPGYTPLEETWTARDIEGALELLLNAKRPIILAGGGIINGNAHEALLALAEKYQIPVTSSLMGLGGFPADHPLYLGFCGMHGHYHANMAIAEADVLLVAGNRLNERQTGKADRFARNATIIHMDMDPTSLNKNVMSTVPLQGDIQSMLTAMIACQTEPAQRETSLARRPEWMDRIAGFKARKTTTTPKHPEVITPQHAIEALFNHLPTDAFVTTEVGQHQMWTAQRFNLSRPRSFISSGGLGTMGFGFPAAMGIQSAFPHATVLDIAGDGSFQMTLQELAVAKDYNLPVKIAVINNSRLGMIRQWQDKMYGHQAEAALTSPDYIKLADAYGCKGFVVDHPDQLNAVLAEAMAIRDCPVIIDIRVCERVDVYPWVPAGGANDEMLTEN